MVEQASHYPQVQLFVSCRKLTDLDTFSKSDPFVDVQEKNTREGQWVSAGRTEIIWDNLNPDFITSFKFNFHFEEQKFLKFRVYDANDKSGNIRNSDFIGECECTLGEIVGAQGQQIIRTLKLPGNKQSRGNIILRTEEVAQCNDKVVMQLGAKGLEDVSGFFHSFKPFIYVSRALENGGAQRVYMSEHLSGKNVSWKVFEKQAQELCNGDYNRPILIELYDHHSSGDHKQVGVAQTSIREMTENPKLQIPIINPTKSKKKNYKNSGFILVKTIQLIQQPSFLEYIAGGCQIHLMVGVDFTASNGHPSNPNSLHFLNPRGYNQYEQALFSVGEILINYDSTKMIDMFGFGGKVQGIVNHCFHMNFSQDPRVPGIQGLMSTYRNSLMSVELNGPTLFSHLIKNAVSRAESVQSTQQNQHYFVLLLLTDGVIHDMRETIDWIVRGSLSPISIVIVGIGNENFQNMEVLDADDTPLVDSRGKKMDRDIVQFVPFREVSNSPTALAREVLDEIPREIVNFHVKRGIRPNPPVQAQSYDFERSYTMEPSAPEAPLGDQPLSQQVPQYYEQPNAPSHPPQPPVNPTYPPSHPPQSHPPQYPPTNPPYPGSYPPNNPYAPQTLPPSVIQAGQHMISQQLQQPPQYNPYAPYAPQHP